MRSRVVRKNESPAAVHATPYHKFDFETVDLRFFLKKYANSQKLEPSSGALISHVHQETLLEGGSLNLRF